jgi:PD-(D/E)XK nuclease superfamily
MRFHQSWYRATKLGIPCGTGPTPKSEKFYGNMLTEQDADRGQNFLSPKIFALAKQRVEQSTGMVEEFRLLRNMLSSQPMCFNLFGPMVHDLDLATALWKLILPGEVERVTRVEFELAPEPINEYLADHTAFDAFVEYWNKKGNLAFVGIETKLTEPFSPKKYDRPEYRRWMEGAGSPWKPKTYDKVADVKHNQLWRDHLLAIAMLRHPSSDYANGRLMLVRHRGDEKCSDIVEGYRELLHEEDNTFIDMPLDNLAGILASGPLDEEWKSWLHDFRLRYLDLAASKGAFNGK